MLLQHAQVLRSAALSRSLCPRWPSARASLCPQTPFTQLGQEMKGIMGVNSQRNGLTWHGLARQLDWRPFKCRSRNEKTHFTSVCPVWFLFCFFPPSLPPPLPQQLHGRQRRAVLEANISINNANGQTVRGHPVLQCAHRSDFTNPRCPQFGPNAIKDIFT